MKTIDELRNNILTSSFANLNNLRKSLIFLLFGEIWSLNRIYPDIKLFLFIIIIQNKEINDKFMK